MKSLNFLSLGMPCEVQCCGGHVCCCLVCSGGLRSAYCSKGRPSALSLLQRCFTASAISNTLLMAGVSWLCSALISPDRETPLNPVSLTSTLAVFLSLAQILESAYFPRHNNLSACVCLSALSTAVLMNLAVSSCLDRIQFSGRHQQLQHSFTVTSTTLQILCCPFHPLARFSSCFLLRPPISKILSVFALFPLAGTFTTCFFRHISSRS